MRRKMRNQWRLEEARDADHVWDPIRDGIDMPAVWTCHGTLVYVDLRRRLQIREEGELKTLPN